MIRFDPLLDPIEDLDDKTLLISASAGTGKTWTVSHLATRWMLEDDRNDPSRLLLVTYSRAAAAELRSRLRSRVAEVGRVLQNPSRADDGWLRSLVDLPEGERERMMRRQAEVLSALDDVNARTIHSFASMVNNSGSATTTAGSLLYERAINESLTRASLADLDQLRVLVNDPTDPEACTGDLSMTHLRERLAATLRGSAAIGGLAERPGGASKALLLDPPVEDAEATARADVLRRLLLDAEQRVRELMAMENDVTFDEMISGVYWDVQEGGDQAVESLRDAFGFVLIDEFQDTDAAQWSIFESVFRGHMPVVIVGDPKQAIYGFRGGDVVIFQRLLAEAAGSETTLTWELDRNFRSGERLIGQLNALFSIAESTEARSLFDGDGALGPLPRPWGYSSPLRRQGPSVQAISYVPVMVGSEAQRAPECVGGLQIRDLTSVRPLARLENGVLPATPLWDTAAPPGIDQDALQESVLDDLVQVIRGYQDDGVGLEDICVLVRINRLAVAARDHLRRHGISAVTTKTEPVFASPAAEQLRCLLWALTEPTNPRFGGLLEVTWFKHHELESLAGLAYTLESYGPGALCRRVLDTATMYEVLRSDQPERSWTDIDHLFSLAGERFGGGVLATSALGWLEEMMEGSEEAKEDEAAVRRVESHGGSVTLMTIHSAKGLEFPIVLCPQIEMPPSAREANKQNGVLSTPDGREFDLNRLVVAKVAEAGEGGVDEALQTSDESARLIYVALTRAKRDLVLWVTDNDRHQSGKSTSEPSRILQTSLLRILVESLLLTTEPQHRAIAERLVDAPFDASIPVVVPEEVDEATALRPIDAEHKEINVDGVVDPPAIDEALRRWSYSTLHVHGTSSAESIEVDDESLSRGYGGGALAEDVATDRHLGARLGSRLFAGYAGTGLGNAIHEVFERLIGHHEAGDEQFLAECILSAFEMQGLAVDEVRLTELTEQFSRLLRYPLGQVMGNASLLEIGAGGDARTANEMRFTLPLEGTGSPSDRLIEIGRFVHDAEPEGPYAGFFGGLASGKAWPTRLFQGYLVGSIDLVAQVGDVPRFAVLDYKSNLLKVASSYAPQDLVGEMALSGYPLQGLLYSVALHRFLDRRLPNYRAEEHLAGICYFYVRGALLEGQGHDAGLANWTIPSKVVIGVSELLAGRSDR